MKNEKQDGYWWVETHTSIHCYCNTWLRVVYKLVDSPQVVICPTCNEKWYVGLIVLPDEFANSAKVVHKLVKTEYAVRGMIP